MARIVVIFSLCLAACDVGELPGLTGDGGGDADGNGCDPIAATIPPGHHNPPMTATGCMSAAGCHSAQLGLGAGAPEYSYAGMLYKADKETPYGGATIVVKLGAALKKTVVADNGEFYMVPGVAGIDPPTNQMTATTSASGCPNVAPMVGALTQGGGDCNKGGCHAPLGSANPGNGPIFLP
jgi:hypothetical protein